MLDFALCLGRLHSRLKRRRQSSQPKARSALDWGADTPENGAGDSPMSWSRLRCLI